MQMSDSRPTPIAPAIGGTRILSIRLAVGLAPVLLAGLLTQLTGCAQATVDSQATRPRDGKVSAGQGSRGDTRPCAPGSPSDRESGPDPATQPALSHARIYPPGARLPASFRDMPWREMNALDVHCMFDGTACEIYTLRPKAGVPTYIVIGGSGSSGRYRGTAFAPSGQGKWYRIGRVEGLQCPGVLEALRAGRARTVPPLIDDLLVGSQRLIVKAFVGFKTCDGPFEELDVDSDRPPDPRDR